MYCLRENLLIYLDCFCKMIVLLYQCAERVYNNQEWGMFLPITTIHALVIVNAFREA